MEPPRPTLLNDSVCTACGCLCDDITLVVEGDRIVEALGACPRGAEWFARSVSNDRPECLVRGGLAPIEEGIRASAKILAEASYPLILLGAETTCETQRAAVAMADRLGGVLDVSAGQEDAAVATAVAQVGQVTATLGEIRHRADLVVLWGADPVETHPRLLDRHVLTPAGRFVPDARAGRTCIVVDSRRTATADRADRFLPIVPDRQREALAALRAMVGGLDLSDSELADATGTSAAPWRDLADRMKRARYGAFLFGAGLSGGSAGPLNVESLLLLTRELNGWTRFVALALRGAGNRAGADNVLAWRTGFPAAVDFSQGYPRRRAAEFSAAAILARGEADAVVTVGHSGLPAVQTGIPVIALNSSSAAALAVGAAVDFTVAAFGLQEPGTVYRMDGIALPLRPAFSSRYALPAEILSAITQLH